MPALTRDERDAFLEQPGILCRIATIRPNGAPMVTPIWFLRDGDNILVTPRKESSWLANLRRDPRVAITIDEEALPYRKLTVEGTARILFDVGHDAEWRDTYRRIACRYVPAEGAEHYIQETIDQPRALLAIPLTGSKTATWRMPLADEEYSGIWHQRYYVPGSKLADH
ncbi:MAG: PPOX class F420-dependent oxidoreductase [Chloroflexi bacterium]|nr:PPOX class F420-dependent oxidoreductase [Chloroflexota bacterium]